MRCAVAFAVAGTFCFSASVRAETVTGKVLDPDGRPLAGAKVYISHPQTVPKYEFLLDKLLTTDANGTFSADLTGLETVGNDGKKTRYFGFATVVAPNLGVAQEILMQTTVTFHLSKSKSVRGCVMDIAGKVVPKATVYIRYFDPRQDKSASIFNRRMLNLNAGKEVAALFTTSTGPDGTFTLSNLPEGGQGSLEVSNPEFASNNVPFFVNGTVLPNIIVHPSAIVTGRVVDEKGVPVSGIDVMLNGLNMYGRATTGTDGTYRIGHLGTGSALLYVNDPKHLKTAEAKSDIKLQEGKTVAVPDVVVQDGGLIEVTVLDDDTGTPLPNIFIGANGPQMPRLNGGGWFGQQTDTAGKCQVRVYPGPSTVFVGSSLPEYPNIGGTHEQSITLTKGQTASIIFRMKKGADIEGTVVDETGNPLSDVHVRILHEWETFEYERNPGTPSDASGRWNATGLPRDGQKLKVFVDGKDEVVSPVSVDIDPTVAKQKPIVVKVKASENRIAEGRILTPDGTPIQGVDVNLYSYTRDSDGNMQGGTNKNVLTDANGQFRIDTLHAKETVQVRPSMNNYRYLSGGESKAEGDNVRFSDIVMTPLTVQVAGRIVNPLGKPVAGALVWSVAGFTAIRMTTDATGKFVLSGLPADGLLRISAAKGKYNSVVEFTLRKGKPITGSLTGLEMTLEASTPTNNLALADQLIETLRQNNGDNREWSFRGLLRSIARRDPDRALRAAEKNGKIKDEDRFAILEAFAEVDPEHAAVWGPPQCEKFISSEWKCAGEGELAIDLATRQPNLANQLYEFAMAHLPGSDSQDAMNSARLIAASALLRRGDEGHLMEHLDNIKPDDYTKMQLASVMARGDMARAEVYIEVNKTDYAVYGYGGLISVAVKTSPQTAKQYLDKMQKLLKADDYGQNQEFIKAARLVIRAMGRTDPETAAKIAHAVPDSDQTRQQRVYVLAEAAAVQKGEAAKALWKETLDFAQNSNFYDKSDQLAAIACLCLSRGGTPERAQEIWEHARTALESNQFLNVQDGFVYASGLFDPALSRMLAELIVENNTNAPPTSQNSYPAAQAGVALVNCDPQYGLGIIDRAPDDRDGTDGKDSSRYNAKVRLAQLLLLTPEQRSRLLYEDFRFGSETWDSDLY